MCPPGMPARARDPRGVPVRQKLLGHRKVWARDESSASGGNGAVSEALSGGQGYSVFLFLVEPV